MPTTLPERPAARHSAGPALNLVERVLYRDGMVLVVDKPAGLPVHGGPGGGVNLEALFDQLRFGLKRPPALAHRLDRDTSGCLVLGRHPKALRRLGALFQTGAVIKTYWALVRGVPPAAAGTIDAALRKTSTRQGGWSMTVDPNGQAASTTYSVRATDGTVSWLELHPQTGRTHQIRVHCAALGCPLLGDPRYGGPDDPAGIALHARAVAVPLYPAKPPIAATAPLPAALADRFASFGFNPG